VRPLAPVIAFRVAARAVLDESGGRMWPYTPAEGV
jgi:hypothetical protein